MTVVQLLPELNEGGVERGTIELSRELVKRGYNSIVISNGGKLVEQLKKDGAKHIKCDVCSKNILTAPFRINKLKKILKEINPDILHYRSRVPGWMVYFANKRLGIPTVSTVHGLNSVSFYSEIMTKGDRVICVSEVVREHILNNYNIDKNKITVIQRGVNTKLFNPNNINNNFIKNFIQKYNLFDKYIVSSIGRITWLKDYETFIKAIAKAKKDIPNIVGLIVGGVREDKKEYFNSLIELSKKYNIKDNIIFTGSINNIAEIYHISDIVVNASLKMGNVGRTVSESLAMNTPVIATTFKGLNNIITDSINGYVIKNKDANDLYNKILRIKHKNMVDVYKTLPKEFTLKYMVEATINVYESLRR